MSLLTLKNKVEELVEKIKAFPNIADEIDSDYTRPSWWLPYPELTQGDNVNEIFLLMEVESDVMEYEGIDLTDTPILQNGKKQFWKRVEGTQIDGEQPDLLEVFANCIDEWCFKHPTMTVSTAITNGKAIYPMLQLISGTQMIISSNANHLAAQGNLRLIKCPINISSTLAGVFAYSVSP